jgi:hypothetical protein
VHFHNEGLNGGARLDDRRVGSPVMIVARLLAIVALVVVTAGLSATAARADSPAAGKSFTLPAGGFDPDVAVDDDGIANVVWAHQNPVGQSDTLEYCQIPRGQTTCDQRDSFTPPLPADDSKAEGRPRVLLPGVDHVVLLTHRSGLVDFNALTGAVDANCAEDGGCVAEDHLTWAYESFDDGKTFQAPELIGVVPTEGGAISFSPTPPFSLQPGSSTPPNNATVTTPTPLVGGVSSGFETTSYNLGFQAAPLNGTTTFDVADLGAGQMAASDNAAVGVTPAGQPLVLGHFSGGLIWSRWDGGPLDDVVSDGSSATWAGGQFSGGDWPTLASGTGGLFALSSTSANAEDDEFVVQKYNGAATGVPFGSATPVASGVAAEFGSNLQEDSAGKLYGVVVARSGGSDALHLLESPDGTTWSTTSLASTETNGIQRPTVSAASDGGGVAVYASGQGANGTLTVVPFGSTALAPGQIDVRVNAMEITQGVQTFELPARDPAHPLNNTVNYHGVRIPNSGTAPQIVNLVDDLHTTVVRVYANSRTKLAPGLVPAMTLEAFRNGKELYPGPILPDTSYDSKLNATRQEPADLPVGGVAQVADHAQTTPNAAYTFTIPNLWTEGDTTFQAEINPAGYTPRVAECPKCGQYDTLRLGPVHFTKIDLVAVEPVALGYRQNGSMVWPLGGLDPDPPYTPQPGGMTQTGGVYNLAQDIVGGSYRPPPFTGMRAATPFTYDVNPYSYLADASEALTDSKLSYADQLSKLTDITEHWADHDFDHQNWYIAGITPRTKTFNGGQTPDASCGGFLSVLSSCRWLYLKHSDPSVGVWSDDRPLTASAHEFGHTVELVHAGLQCGSNANHQVGEPWAPDDNGDFDGVGLDTTAPSPYRILSWNETAAPTDSALSPPGSSPESEIYDLMSYCNATSDKGGGNDNDDHWLSVENWNHDVGYARRFVGQSPAHIVDEARVASAPGAAMAFARPASAVRSLEVDVSNDILANQAQVVSITPSSGTPTAATASAMYVLRSLDAGGHVIASDAVTGGLNNVEPKLGSSTVSSQTPSIVQITGLIPSNAAAVQVVENGQVIASRTASAHAPRIRITSPRRGQRVGSGGHAVLRWSASDADGDALTATVNYSVDGGRTWVTIYSGPATPGRVSLPSRLLGHSSHAMARVDVNDGFHQTSATSKIFTAVGAPPTVMLTAPAMHTRVTAGGNLNLAATAFDDYQRRLSGREIRWTAGRFVIGTGETLTADNLPAGRYRLTATAIDSSGRKGSASVPIVVLPTKPLLRIFKAPRSVSRHAKTLKLKARAVTPLVLAVGRHQFLVTRTLSTLTVPITPGRKPLTLQVTLRSGPNKVKLVAKVRRH